MLKRIVIFGLILIFVSFVADVYDVMMGFVRSYTKRIPFEEYTEFDSSQIKGKEDVDILCASQYITYEYGYANSGYYYLEDGSLITYNISNQGEIKYALRNNFLMPSDVLEIKSLINEANVFYYQEKEAPFSDKSGDRFFCNRMGETVFLDLGSNGKVYYANLTSKNAATKLQYLLNENR